MVAVYHYPVEYIPGFIHNSFIVSKSHLFVDFFFVLSGFVITYNYHNLINTRAELGRSYRNALSVYIRYCCTPLLYAFFSLWEQGHFFLNLLTTNNHLSPR